MPLVEQELLTLPEHLSSPLDFSEVRVTRSLVLFVCFVDRCLSFCTFSFGLVLSVLLRYTDSDYPFGIFKLFLNKIVFMHVISAFSPLIHSLILFMPFRFILLVLISTF